jgi:adenine/guanine phosphoribosyltransferase-like PRPP-binding protein
MRLAALAAQPDAGYSALQCLHWGEQFQKARDGGPRDVARLYANSRVRDDLPPQRIILIDDVVTGGGHLIACARALRSRGHTVEHAICAAHTVKSPPAQGLWNIEPWDLEADPFEGLFGS